MNNGVTFGDKHSFSDWGLIFSHKSISSPEPQVKNVNVPGRNGNIDMSQVLTGDVRYNNRQISVTFYAKRKLTEYPAFLSAIENYIQGKKCRIVFDDDPAFYWYGRCSLDNFKLNGKLGEIVIKADVDPFKYNITTSEDDWLWDPFDFEQSVLNELANIEVDGHKEVIIIGARKWENPIIMASNDMTVTYGGKKYALHQGSQVMYEIIIEAGENILTFEGQGTVSINYIGGSL